MIFCQVLFCPFILCLAFDDRLNFPSLENLMKIDFPSKLNLFLVRNVLCFCDVRAKSERLHHRKERNEKTKRFSARFDAIVREWPEEFSGVYDL